MAENEDDMETAQMDIVPWLPPVASADDLPRTGVDEGTLCFVHTSDSVWRFRDGRWVEIGRVPLTP
ncbi:MAG: hypothetical protein ABMA64_14065 [Myxococcota bacterium]